VKYHFTDMDGDRLAVFPAEVPGHKPGVNIKTDPDGSTLLAEDIPAFIQAVHDALAEAQTAVLESGIVALTITKEGVVDVFEP
jgi:hypothetical protein